MVATAAGSVSSGMHDFRRLVVWQLSREFAVSVHGVTRSFPRSDRGVVAGQLRRAALSIPANIAEGCGKGSPRETLRFMNIAAGSVREVESHILIAADLHYLDCQTRDSLLSTTTSIGKMLFRLMQYLGDGRAERRNGPASTRPVGL
jgi:four helix bundle protein